MLCEFSLKLKKKKILTEKGCYLQWKEQRSVHAKALAGYRLVQ